MKKSIYYRLEYTPELGEYYAQAQGYLDENTDVVYENQKRTSNNWRATDFETGLLLTPCGFNTMKECQEHVSRIMCTVLRRRELPEMKEYADRLYRHCLELQVVS